MRCYECKCLHCNSIKQITFAKEPYPEYGAEFLWHCATCQKQTAHTRTLTQKAAAEIRKKQAEQQLRQRIIDKCTKHRLSYRFLYNSVIITTQLADWCFDYHQSKITLYHESTIKINFATGDYAKAHIQFKERKMAPEDVIEYIVAHDKRKNQA